MSLPPESYKSESAAIYNRSFVWAYLANMSLVAANTLAFRFAEFIHFLNGSEAVAGRIVAYGLIGALISRIWLGQAIDRFGVRRIWLIGTMLFLVGSGTMLSTQVLGTGLFVARVAYEIGTACMFVCSNLHIQLRVPEHRRTEAIGSLGSSGFVGMIVGAQLGNWVFSGPATAILFTQLFSTMIIFGLLYLIFVLMLTHSDNHVRPEITPPVHVLMRRYWPGPVVLVALMMGLGFAVTMVYVTRLATTRGGAESQGFGVFFTCYALSAFSFRLSTRTLSRKLGRRVMILCGLMGHAIGHLTLIFAHQSWQFAIPAICIGFGHALLFPCVVSLGSEPFPPQYRGTGTTMILAFIDLGRGIMSPLLGWIIVRYAAAGFEAMLITTTAILTLSVPAYAWLSRGHQDIDLHYGDAISTAAEE